MQLHPQCTVYWLAWLLFKDDLVFGREDDLGRRKSLREASGITSQDVM